VAIVGRHAAACSNRAALALRPAVMLMDEPFAALDAMTKASMQDELLRVRDRTGTSFVFITHDIEEAVYLGDRIAVLKGSPGRIDQIFEIGLPAPRDQLSTRQLPKFLEYRYAVHQAIGADMHKNNFIAGINWPGTAVFVFVGIAWEAAVRSGLLEYEYLPAPSAIVWGLANSPGKGFWRLILRTP